VKKQGVTIMGCVLIVLICIIVTSIISIYIYKNVYTKTHLDNDTNQSQETTNEIEKKEKTTYTYTIIAGENVQIISQNKNGTMKFYAVCPKCGKKYFLHKSIPETGIRSYNSSGSEYCWGSTHQASTFNYSYYVQANKE